MAGQDELEQVGVEIIVKEPVAQDTPMQEDVPPQPNPEVAMGAGAAANNRPPPLTSNVPPDPWRICARPRQIGFIGTT